MKLNKIFGIAILGIGITSLMLSIEPIVSEDFIKKQTEKKVKLENPNNHPLIDYNDSNHISGVGSRINSEFVTGFENENILINQHMTIFPFKIKDGYSFEDVEIDSVYFTLYEFDNAKLIEVAEYKTDKIRKNDWHEGKNQFSLKLTQNLTLNTEGLNLQEFKSYKIGFNIYEHDESNVFSDAMFLGVPFLYQLKISPQDSALLIQWEFFKGYTHNVSFTFDEIYAVVDRKKYSLGQEFKGEFLIDNLKPAHQYQIIFGYVATKNFIYAGSYKINANMPFSVTTEMPQNYVHSILIAWFIFLILLLIIIIILIGVVLYWNKQRNLTYTFAVANKDQAIIIENNIVNKNHKQKFSFKKEKKRSNKNGSKTKFIIESGLCNFSQLPNNKDKSKDGFERTKLDTWDGWDDE